MTILLSIVDGDHEAEQITDEEREEVQRKGGFYSAIVDLRTFAAFLTALQFPTTRMRCGKLPHDLFLLEPTCLLSHHSFY